MRVSSNSISLSPSLCFSLPHPYFVSHALDLNNTIEHNSTNFRRVYRTDTKHLMCLYCADAAIVQFVVPI